MNNLQIKCRVFLYIIFSSLEKRYEKKSLKSIIIENSVSKLYPLNIELIEKKNLKYDSNLENFYKFKTNLLAEYGEKISYQTHAFFLNGFNKNIDKKMTTTLSLLNQSRKNSYIDLKLYTNCLNVILKTNCNIDLYFREEYEILKAEYFLHRRLVNLSFKTLDKLFFFSKKTFEINFFTRHTVKMIEFLQILIIRLNFFNPKDHHWEKTLKLKKLNQKDEKFFLKHNIECRNLYFEQINKIFKTQLNWTQNRHYLKKVFRENHFFNLVSCFRRIDFYGCLNAQKFHKECSGISFDIFCKKIYGLFSGKLIRNRLIKNVGLLI